MRFAPLVLSLLVALASPAGAVTIVVTPGPGTPLQDAIDAAPPGAKLIAEGQFHEAIVIDKALTIKGGGLLEPACGTANDAMTITADDVKISRFAILGGVRSSIRIEGATNVRLIEVGTYSGPSAGTCADTQYGIDAHAVTKLGLRRCRTTVSGVGTGFTGSWVHLDGLSADARVKLTHLFSNYNKNGYDVLIENSGTPGSRKPVVRIKNSFLLSTHAGIVLRNVAGAEIKGNDIVSHNFNLNTPGDGGVVLDAMSTENVVVRNRFQLNSPNILDQGTGNIIANNEFVP